MNQPKTQTQLTGKYAVVNLHHLPSMPTTPEALAHAILANPDVVQFGADAQSTEFFVLKLQDIHAEPALRAYAASAATTSPDYANAVQTLASRAGRFHPQAKQPD